MGMVIQCGGLFSYPRLKHGVVRIRIACSSEAGVVGTSDLDSGVLRLKVLEQVDKELAKGKEREALSLVKDLQGKPGGLRCFGAVRQVPQRLYTLDELKLNGIDASSILSPEDTTLGSIERSLQVASALGGVVAWSVFGLTQQQILYLSVGLLFIWSLDLVNTGKVSSSMLNKFSCISLAGVATEYILFGYSEGGLSDIYQLDGLLKGLGIYTKEGRLSSKMGYIKHYLNFASS
ncbi:hypothetical protein AQUCO_02600102v1 [Aquilegia coerulea]|uniref:Uncharacterized protein n=1 Tax=Aquilegia coerulea TaxID=218851 RepID=A0A2G5D7D0_AQUCA|nr:hypothetical protein AQUCO_02600102v1 [Aquilegia coerulea]